MRNADSDRCRPSGVLAGVDRLARHGVASGLTVPVSVQDYYDWDKITTLLAEQGPLFPPGTVTGYHAITWGYLVGEVVRRITGQTCGQFFAAEIAGPLGADFDIGLPESELGRCSEMRAARLTGEEQAARAQAFAAAPPAALAALANPPLTGDEANEAAWRMAEIPAANGHGTALALAMIFGTVTDGSQRLVSSGTLEAARAGEGRHTDLVLGFPLEWGLGFALSGPEHAYGPNPAAFGHDGYGGSCVGGDPEAGLAYAYVMNAMGTHIANDPRKMTLIDAVYRSLG